MAWERAYRQFRVNESLTRLIPQKEVLEYHLNRIARANKEITLEYDSDVGQMIVSVPSRYLSDVGGGYLAENGKPVVGELYDFLYKFQPFFCFIQMNFI
jgi:hypothetical protein